MKFVSIAIRSLRRRRLKPPTLHLSPARRFVLLGRDFGQRNYPPNLFSASDFRGASILFEGEPDVTNGLTVAVLA